jgi:hypothetical protein
MRKNLKEKWFSENPSRACRSGQTGKLQVLAGLVVAALEKACGLVPTQVRALPPADLIFSSYVCKDRKRSDKIL